MRCIILYLCRSKPVYQDWTVQWRPSHKDQASHSGCVSEPGTPQAPRSELYCVAQTTSCSCLLPTMSCRDTSVFCMHFRCVYYTNYILMYTIILYMYVDLCPQTFYEFPLFTSRGRSTARYNITSSKKHFMKNVKECRDVIVKKVLEQGWDTRTTHYTHVGPMTLHRCHQLHDLYCLFV